jgi:hypothetical protein
LYFGLNCCQFQDTDEYYEGGMLKPFMALFHHAWRDLLKAASDEQMGLKGPNARANVCFLLNDFVSKIKNLHGPYCCDFAWTQLKA